MNLSLKATWLFEMDAVEIRLVLKALGGRLSTDDEAAAKSLGDDITRLRAASSRALHDAMEHNRTMIDDGEVS